MSRSLPTWSVPLMLVLLAVVLAVGRFSTPWAIVFSAEAVAYAGYVLWRGRSPSTDSPASVSNVLSLFPGHLLLLLALGLTASSWVLLALWTLVPAVSVAYDVVTMRVPMGARFRSSILMILYGILWTDLLYLLERVIARSRGFTRGNEIIAAVAFGVFGILFVSVGIYRHWRAGKE